MYWLECMNTAINYLEKNMTGKLDIERAAEIALSSPFHFQRMFHMITGVTIAEYVRRRKLTLAAQEILSGEKVIDVALKYGYETPEAFTKAFRRLHGMSPSAARGSGAKLRAFPKLSFHISVKGENDMNYRIIEKESFHVIGRERHFTTSGEENFNRVPAFWNDCIADGSYSWVCSHAGNLGVLGICKDFDADYKDFSYMIAIEEPTDSIPEGYVSAVIPAATWAVFEAVGPLPASIQEAETRIYSEWLPATGYQVAEAPELEVYPVGDVSAPDYKCEVWIPVKK